MGSENGATIRKAALWLNDIVCVLMSYVLALLARFGFGFWRLGEFGFSSSVALSLISLVTVVNYLVTLNRGFMRRGPLEEIRVVVVFNLVLLLGLLIAAFGLRITPMISRAVIALFIVLDIIVMFASRLLVKYVARCVYGMGLGQEMVVVVMARGREVGVLAALDLPSIFKIDGVLFVDEDEIAGSIHGNSFACSSSALADALVPYRVDSVYFAAEEIDRSSLSSMVEGLHDGGVDCYLSLQLPVDVKGGSTLSAFGGMPSLAFVRKERKPYEVIVKRSFDIFASLFGLLATVLIGIVLVPLIRIESPGPAIFSQIRVGRNGRQFKFYKFRSMYQDAESRKASLMERNRIDGLMFKADHDPRITRVGQFIRKTSLDEFPQFWNVLIGDMSLVGTRPPTMDEFVRYTGWYKRRLSIKPGVTGLWQVSGRSSITNFEDVVRLDLEYIDNWSLGLDAKILFKTVGTVLRGDGAE